MRHQAVRPSELMKKSSKGNKCEMEQALSIWRWGSLIMNVRFDHKPKRLDSIKDGMNRYAGKDATGIGSECRQCQAENADRQNNSIISPVLRHMDNRKKQQHPN